MESVVGFGAALTLFFDPSSKNGAATAGNRTMSQIVTREKMMMEPTANLR
jgi:hypothetical protein